MQRSLACLATQPPALPPSPLTPPVQYAAYGATKAAIAQLLRTLQTEAAGLPGAAEAPVCVHNLSPGMVLTDLLLEGATPRNKQARFGAVVGGGTRRCAFRGWLWMWESGVEVVSSGMHHPASHVRPTLPMPTTLCQVFNILCEHPETVAAFLVPRARSVVARGDRGAAIRYLTPARVVGKLLAAPLRAGRYFDAQGEAGGAAGLGAVAGELRVGGVAPSTARGRQRGMGGRLEWCSGLLGRAFILQVNHRHVTASVSPHLPTQPEPQAFSPTRCPRRAGLPT